MVARVLQPQSGSSSVMVLAQALEVGADEALASGTSSERSTAGRSSRPCHRWCTGSSERPVMSGAASRASNARREARASLSWRVRAAGRSSVRPCDLSLAGAGLVASGTGQTSLLRSWLLGGSYPGWSESADLPAEDREELPCSCGAFDPVGAVMLSACRRAGGSRCGTRRSPVEARERPDDLARLDRALADRRGWCPLSARGQCLARDRGRLLIVIADARGSVHGGQAAHRLGR